MNTPVPTREEVERLREQVAALQELNEYRSHKIDAMKLQIGAKEEEIRDFAESLRHLLDIVEPMTAGDFSVMEMAQIEGARILLGPDSRHRNVKPKGDSNG